MFSNNSENLKEKRWTSSFKVSIRFILLKPTDMRLTLHCLVLQTYHYYDLHKEVEGSGRGHTWTHHLPSLSHLDKNQANASYSDTQDRCIKLGMLGSFNVIIVFVTFSPSLPQLHFTRLNYLSLSLNYCVFFQFKHYIYAVNPAFVRMCKLSWVLSGVRGLSSSFDCSHSNSKNCFATNI